MKFFTDFEVGENGGGLDDDVGGTGMGTIWREELQRRYQQENDFLAELRARNAALNHQTHNNHQQQQQMNHHQQNNNQQEHPGEREEAEGEKRDDAEAEWSEALKNWVNR